MSKVLMESLKLDLPALAEMIRSKGRGKDTMLAHITPKEAALLKRRGGSGSVNPDTGLPEFEDSGDYDFSAPDTVSPYTDTISSPVEAPPAAYDNRDVGLVEQPGVAPVSPVFEQIGPSGVITPYTGGAPAAPGVARIAPTQVGPAFTPGEVAKPEQGIPSKIGDYLSSEKGLNTLARLGLTGALGAFGATQARKAGGQTQAATQETKAIAQPYTEQGKTLVGAAQRGELTPQSQQVLAAYKAQQAQGVATRGGVGQQQADAATANLYNNLLDNQYKYGLQIMQIGDNITLGAIKSGLQLDQQLQQTTNNFYSQLASIAAGGSGQIPFATPAARTA
jgi:hypothetical protein